MLGLDAQSEGGLLRFFCNLDGKWESRVRSVQRQAVSGNTLPKLNGFELMLMSTANATKSARGRAPPAPAPLKLGRFNGAIDNLHIENPRPWCGYATSRRMLSCCMPDSRSE